MYPFEDFTDEQLHRIARDIQAELDSRNPVLIEQNKLQKLFHERQDRTAAINAARNAKIREYLKEQLVPGQRLKMKGCKDGIGLREFIRWDDQGNLVCWQLRYSRKLIAGGKYSRSEERTNQVTTHYPDKVQWVEINRVEVSMSKLFPTS